MSSQLGNFSVAPPLFHYLHPESGRRVAVSGAVSEADELNEELISNNKWPSAGFDFASGKKIEQVLADYNKEAERFWGALLYVVTDQHKRPCKLYCCMLGSSREDILLIDEAKDINIRDTKDFRYVAIQKFLTTSSKGLLLDSADPLSGMRLVWEGEAFVHCIVKHHHGYLFLFTDAAEKGQLADNH
ncbi:hypothetical protein AKJ16_DCAP05655 [Drosera capensis]